MDEFEPKQKPLYTFAVKSGTLKAYSVDMRVVEIWLNSEKIDTHYGNAFDVLPTMQEWKVYYNAK